MKPVYIHSAVAISPQHSFGGDMFAQAPVSSDNGQLYVIDPDYRPYINPVAIRRMSRIIKMGIACGMEALKQANITAPDAIITGTGRGSMTDMEIFLKDMIRLKEEALNPTYFIQSTYNSVNGWLALQTKCTGYNQTYVHRGASLELALLDAQLLLDEATDTTHVLAGSIDEMTPEYFLVKSKIGYWKQPPISSLQLLQHGDTPGTVGGEGAAFFTISNDADNALCTLAGMKMLHRPTTAQLQGAIHTLLDAQALTVNDIDVALCGMNGDSRQQSLYEPVLDVLPATTAIGVFKHLCGEYDTSTGFALWLATKVFDKQELPHLLTHRKGGEKAIKNLLLVNHYLSGDVSVILLRK